MLNTSARLLQLLALLVSRRDWSARELASRLSITERTVRRDVDRLRQLGYVVDSTRGTDGGYRLGFGTGVPPLLLEDEEAVAVALALRSAAVSGLAGVEEVAVQALVKLEQLLPAALRRRVETLDRAVVPLTNPGPTTEVSVLMTAATAVRDHQELRADYRTHRGTTIARVVQPHRVVRAGERWYLVGWDVEREDWRTFRLDRLTPRTPLGRHFTPRPLSDAEVTARVAEGITARVYRYRLEITVLAPAAAVGAVVGPTRGRVTALDDARCTVTGGGNDLAGMARWVAGLGFDVEVHEPAELREHLLALAARLVAAARPGPT